VLDALDRAGCAALRPPRPLLAQRFLETERVGVRRMEVAMAGIQASIENLQKGNMF